MALITKDLAVSGVSGSGNITYTFILRVTENSTNIEKNTSDVTVQAILRQTYSGTAFSSWSTGVACTVNGSQLFSDYRQRSITGTGEHVYYTWTGTLDHAADGTLVLRIGGRLWQNSSASFTPPALTVPETAVTLTRIPRASTLGATDGVIGGNSTLVIARASEAFTHTLHYAFGDAQGYIDGDGQLLQVPVQLKQTTVSFSIPESFYAQLPDAPYGDCTLTCHTYSGEVLIGTTVTTFRITAEESRCAPTVVGSAEDVNPATVALTGNSGVVVRYMSQLQCGISAQPGPGATVRELKIAGVTVQDSLNIEQAESGSIDFSVCDSRGYTATARLELPVVPYVKLTNNARAARTAPTTGEVMLTFTGNCYAGSFGSRDNTLTGRYRSCPEGGSFGPWQEISIPLDTSHTYQTQLQLTDFDYTKSHTLEVQVTDTLETVSRTLTLQQGIPVFDWGRDRFSFHVPVHFDSGLSGVHIRTHELSGGQSFTIKAQANQALLLFGTSLPVLGILCFKQDGSCSWTGTQGVQVQTAPTGVTVTIAQPCTGEMTVIAPGGFSIE